MKLFVTKLNRITSSRNGRSRSRKSSSGRGLSARPGHRPCRLETLQRRDLLSAGVVSPPGDYDDRTALIAPPLDKGDDLVEIDSGGVRAMQDIQVSTVEELNDALLLRENLAPGSTISIAPGTYYNTDRWRCYDFAGTEQAPITIEGSDPDNPPLFIGGADWWIIDNSYVVFRNLTIRLVDADGNRTGDKNAMRISVSNKVPFDQLSPTHHITVDNVTILEAGMLWGSGDALKPSSVDYLTIRNSYFEGWAEQAIDLMGCQHVVIEDSQFIGSDVRGVSWKGGIQIKGGSNHVLVQGNFFHNTSDPFIKIGGSGTTTGGVPSLRALPGETLADGTVFDFLARDVEVAGNRFYCPANERLSLKWTTSDGGYVHHNTFVTMSSTLAKGSKEEPHELMLGARNGRFENNLVVFNNIWFGHLVKSSPSWHPETFTFNNNAWYCLDPDPPRVDDTRESINNELADKSIPVEETGVYGIDPELDSLDSPTMRIRSTNPVFDDIGADAWSPQAEVLDNGDPGFDAHGVWMWFPGWGFDGDSHLAEAGTGSQAATWSFSLTPGQYRLAATWQENEHAASDSPYAVLDQSGELATIRVNQKRPADDFRDRGAGWRDLGTYTVTGNALSVRLTDDADAIVIADAVRCERVETGARARVVGRHLFYNGSFFDGHDPAAGPQDDDAIAPDKTALLPGQAAGFQNYSSYSRGINGVMVDVMGLTGAAGLTADDFTFKAGNGDDPGAWAAAPAPQTIAVRAGAGLAGSHRVTLIWDDNAIQNQWLQVTVRPTPNTGLAEADVFYFGNAVGETGNSTTDAKVNARDMILTLNNLRDYLNLAPLDLEFDFDRDGRVNTTDLLIMRASQTNLLTALRLITAPE